MRAIDADALNSIKFHPLPYTHIVPDDVNAESYERGWNDAVDAIIENAPTIEPERKTGKWIKSNNSCTIRCNQCGQEMTSLCDIQLPNYCLNCGSQMMRGEEE